MMKPAQGKHLVLFLDYDGTLTPIVDDPARALMSEEMRSALQKVARVFPTAIVSGRSRNKVEGFVKLKNITYAGSHGMDILTVDDGVVIVVIESGNGDFLQAEKFLPTIKKIKKVLEEKIKIIKGAAIEDNKFCISVHFRRVNVEDVHSLKELVESVRENYPNLYTTGGKKIIEIRPRIDWDKGRALQYLIQNLGFNVSDDFLPMYVGDDRTDEDAFKVIREMGRGYPIIVSSIPKETKATYSLRDPNEVMSFLIHLFKWRTS
ncbi:hypothetical protein JCGZ_14270 [Jatropha curcas]|uniref:Trehalose 6-phosphate phosphatase n=2 Tax=Jatropha curcas TaxID=180498 RepID=A0A067K9K5_JATCU|nr:hypothetical protein JCGZ_14270 [Jatropha curcas]